MYQRLKQHALLARKMADIIIIIIIEIELAILLCDTNPLKLQSSLPMNNELEIFVTNKNSQVMISTQSYSII